MTTSTGQVRPRRSRKGLTVAVTGAASEVGGTLLAALVGSERVTKVIALDVRRGTQPEATWRLVDLTSPALAGRLESVDVLVHRADVPSELRDVAARREQVVRTTQTVVTSAAAAGVHRLVVITSATVYGAHADNPIPLDEDAPLRAEPDDSPVGDLLEVETLLEQARTTYPGLEITVLRPATLVGADEPSLVSRHFESPRLLVVRESEPRWQFVHIDDLASAVELAAVGTVTGSVTVGAEGALTQEQVEALSGRRRVELPLSLALATAQRLHRLGVTSAPSSELAYVSQPWVVPSSRLLEAGWKATWDNVSCFEELLHTVEPRYAVAGRRVTGKEAALGATGATVAVLGTAAVVRQIRRHRRGF